jgi:2-iminobutanoate/2-iminopropanoate deaminase
MPRQGVNSPEFRSSDLPFSHFVVTGGATYVSGQVALDPATGTLIEGDVTAQTEQIFVNLHSVLKAAGKDLGDIVKTTVFLTDMRDYAAMNAVYARQFTPPYPARSAIAVAALPLGARVEIECIANGGN